MCLISIITVVFNASTKIKVTLDSVAKQVFKDYEMLIIDGVSKDDTLKIARSYSGRISNLRIYSEPDNGIYDAMNKGIDLSDGEYVYFLNAGDTLYDEYVFDNIAKHLDGKSVYYGDSYISDGDGNIISYRCGYFSKFRFALTNMCHQTIFYPRSLIRDNLFNLRYPLQADYELNLRLWRFSSFNYLKTPIILYEGGGVSDTICDDQFRKVRRMLVFRCLGVDAWMYIVLMKFIRVFKKQKV